MNPQAPIKQPLLDLSLSALADYLRALGEQPFRAKQIHQWLYHELADSFGAMSNLPKPLRDKLEERSSIAPLTAAATSISTDRLTNKALLRLQDGNAVESVMMIYRPTSESRARRTVCVSSQAGCAVGCPFCATGRAGLVRNLTPGEIVGQVLHFARTLKARYGGEEKVTNVVFMGQGEPMANLSAVWSAIEALNSPFGFNLGARHITISTAGLVPGIIELAGKPLQVGLAVSLHAPDDELRSQLVPVNKRYPIGELLRACREYLAHTNRRITFEYALIGDVNDAPEQAEHLAGLLRDMLCHVNLIPLNDVAGSPYHAPSGHRVLAFQSALQKRGIIATVRAERGGHIDAACGQLKAKRT